MLTGKCVSSTANIFVSSFVLSFFFITKYRFSTADVVDFNEKV